MQASTNTPISVMGILTANGLEFTKTPLECINNGSCSPILKEAGQHKPDTGREVSGSEDVDRELEHHSLRDGYVEGALQMTEELHHLHEQK